MLLFRYNLDFPGEHESFREQNRLKMLTEQKSLPPRQLYPLEFGINYGQGVNHLVHLESGSTQSEEYYSVCFI